MCKQKSSKSDFSGKQSDQRVFAFFRNNLQLTTVKPVLSGHLEIEVLIENGSLMEVKSIAECSKGISNNRY